MVRLLGVGVIDRRAIFVAASILLSYCADLGTAEQRGTNPAAIPRDDRRGLVATREAVDKLDEVSGRNRAGGRQHRHLQNKTPAEKYYDLDWSDLPSDVQPAYETLLTTEEIWCGESDEDPIADYDWDDLSNKMKEKAKFLGYTEEIWCTDEKTGEWTCGVDTPAPSTKVSFAGLSGLSSLSFLVGTLRCTHK